MMISDSSETSVNIALHGVTFPQRVTFNPTINHRSVSVMQNSVSRQLCCFECVFFVFNFRHSLPDLQDKKLAG